MSGVVQPAVYGYNLSEGAESCDGIDPGGQTCSAQGFSGTLTCNGE